MRDIATGSILGVSLIVRLDMNDVSAEIGSLAGPDISYPECVHLSKEDNKIRKRAVPGRDW